MAIALAFVEFTGRAVNAVFGRVASHNKPVGKRYRIAGLSREMLANLVRESGCFRIVSGADERLVW